VFLRLKEFAKMKMKMNSSSASIIEYPMEGLWLGLRF
jgi:hypothetical protein